MSWIIKGNGTGQDLLYSQAGTPSLDLRFASTKSLNDYVSGNNLITFTRASTGTFVGSNGLIQTAAINAPRFDHNPQTGESLGLLVEEARTNLLLRSEDFATTWTPGNATVPVSGQTTPAGTTNANSLTGDGNNSTHLVLQSVTFTAAAHTLSVYAKKGTNNFLQLRFGAGGIASGNGFANFNLDTGVVGTVGSGISAASITAAGNGWYRCSITGTTLAAASNVGLYIVTSATAVSAELNTLATTINIWGAQLEAGAFPTSYIPTTTAAATRAADVAQITGSNFSSWYNQTEGTVFAAYSQPAFGIAIAAIDDGATSNNSIVLFTSSGANQKASANMLLASANQGRIDAGGTFAPNVLNQAALAVSANGRALSCNGSAVSTSTNPSSMPSLSRLGIQGDNTFVSGKGGHIKRLTYWPTRLDNTTLQTITQ